jgi:DNA-binding NtrC family response regulator
VTEVSDGAEAVARVEADPNAFDIVLMDMNMPVMSGRDAFLAIHRRNPELPVLLVSGFVPDATAAELTRLGVAGFIDKPCRISELSAHVARVLEKASRARELRPVGEEQKNAR